MNDGVWVNRHDTRSRRARFSEHGFGVQCPMCFHAATSGAGQQTNRCPAMMAYAAETSRVACSENACIRPQAGFSLKRKTQVFTRRVASLSLLPTGIHSTKISTE
jgi:hypothetical protein